MLRGRALRAAIFQQPISPPEQFIVRIGHLVQRNNFAISTLWKSYLIEARNDISPYKTDLGGCCFGGLNCHGCTCANGPHAGSPSAGLWRQNNRRSPWPDRFPAAWDFNLRHGYVRRRLRKDRDDVAHEFDQLARIAEAADTDLNPSNSLSCYESASTQKSGYSQMRTLARESSTRRSAV
jgi:hypothetical protein